MPSMPASKTVTPSSWAIWFRRSLTTVSGRGWNRNLRDEIMVVLVVVTVMWVNALAADKATATKTMTA